MFDRSVLVASNYNAWPEAFNSQAYAFLDVIRSVEFADVVAPEALSFTKGRTLRPTFGYLIGELAFRSVSQLRRGMGLTRYSTMQPVRLKKDYDLFFFMCQFPIELSALKRIHGWRERSGKAVAFVLETWSHKLHTAKAELRLLDDFDHVFVLNAASIPHLAKFTSAPCSFLATASDCLLGTPFPDPPERTVDVFSIGRRSPHAHDQLIEMARASNSFLYVYDTTRQGIAINWAETRLLTASLIKRSKFFVAYDHTVVDRGGISKDFNERSISTRYFEGAAGGAVMIGTAPACPEFERLFDWEDALIEIPANPENLSEILAGLSARPERLQRISTVNAIQSLRRHDWAHRWDEVLKALGLSRTKKMQQRLDELDELAYLTENASGVAVAC
jgi:Glycosyl transferases group 1